jgi:hypothetical protein
VHAALRRRLRASCIRAPARGRPLPSLLLLLPPLLLQPLLLLPLLGVLIAPRHA